jgi:hypothetical protein
MVKSTGPAAIGDYCMPSGVREEEVNQSHRKRNLKNLFFEKSRN